MIEHLDYLPKNVAGFRAKGIVTADDYQNAMEPAVAKLAEDRGELNFLFIIDSKLADFTSGAWLQDAFIGIKHLTKWNRAAIVTDNEGAIKFTDLFSYLAPGEFRGFPKYELYKATEWDSGTSSSKSNSNSY